MSLLSRRRRAHRASGGAVARGAARHGCERQITELSCEEGWSYIAEWIRTPLAKVLDMACVKPGSLAGFGTGKGSADAEGGYSWYAGI